MPGRPRKKRTAQRLQPLSCSNTKLCFKAYQVYQMRREKARGWAALARENLRAARKAARLTQQQVADKLGIGLVHYQKEEQKK